MFVNTAALRIGPAGEKAVGDFLNEIRRTSIEAIEHQNYPYGELVKKLGIRASNRNPLFDVMFAYQSERVTDVTFAGEKAEALPVPVTTAKYDLTFNVLPRESDVVLMAEYCTDLYRESTVRRMLTAYRQILTQMLETERRLKDLSAVVPEELQKLLYDFNDTAAEYPKEKCVHELFEEQAAKSPDRTAVIFKEEKYTYSELKALTDRYCAVLQALGVKKGDVVAVHIGRSHRLIAFQLAVLKAGGTFLPVDKRYPTVRIRDMCKNCNVKLFVSDEQSIPGINGIALKDFESIAAERTAKAERNTDVCYIIYTSGSAGVPKGCMLTNGGLVNFCLNNNTLKTLKKSKENVFACVNSVSFDYFIAESLLPLLNGYTTVVLDDGESAIQRRFLDVAQRNGINVVMTTPTRLRIYFSDSCGCRTLNSLSCICTSGEPLPPELLDVMFRKAPRAEIYNTLGPSECSVWDVGGMLERERGLDIHIGKPTSNTQIYIVDKYLQPVPVGVTGELCIAGDGVGAGYLNRPELTAEKFVDNPFGSGKLYRTGDLAYWREDGNIAYVGRNDFQVKIRGLRIELGEIENALAGVDGVGQAVAVVRRNAEGRQLICAFYTGKKAEAKALRTLLSKSLPKYMLPHVFTHVEEMPLTSSGKIDRRSLPEIDLENIAGKTEYIPPVTAVQKGLCALAEQILHTSPVGLDDDFFDLGGDSLKAIEYVSAAHEDGIWFNIQNVFDYPTVRRLCDFMESGGRRSLPLKKEDFERANRILSENAGVPDVAHPEKDVGNLLLAGATGFLGSHLLADFLGRDGGTAYCLVRGRDASDSERRLRETLRFYFGNACGGCGRIKVVCGDLQREHFGLGEAEYTALLSETDTVLNAAGSVKHYGSYPYFYDVNVMAVKRLIGFCREANARLIHISTLSVSGGRAVGTEKRFDEACLYIGQTLDNVYAKSKFEAEKAVLDAMTDGLRANILRMGNLTNRFSDGVFQKNYESNAFLQRLRAILALGLIPKELTKIPAEFTPVDAAADAAMTLVRHFSTEKTVFHLNSPKVLRFERLRKYFDGLGFPVEPVGREKFTTALREAAQDGEMRPVFEAFLSEQDLAESSVYGVNINMENDFTVWYLRRLGFEWPEIDPAYIGKYVGYFKRIGVFK